MRTVEEITTEIVLLTELKEQNMNLDDRAIETIRCAIIGMRWALGDSPVSRLSDVYDRRSEGDNRAPERRFSEQVQDRRKAERRTKCHFVSGTEIEMPVCAPPKGSAD